MSEGKASLNVDEKEALSVEEMCDLHGLSKPTLYGEINSGRLRAVKVGRRTLILKEARADWRKQLAPAVPDRVA